MNINISQITYTADVFGIEPAENFDEVYAALIRDDLQKAQANLDALPKSDRRGLTMDTLRHFNCGYLPDWILTKSRAEFLCGIYINKKTDKPKRLPPPSPRIIIPTSERHFHATATDTARRSMSKDYWKQHGGKMDGESFNVADALKHDLIVVVEGEIDAMSIWQATQGAVAAVAILGCKNGRKSLLPYVDDLRGKKLLLLLDADKAGKDAAKEFLNELSGLGLLAVNRTLYEVMPAADQKEFGCRPKEVDANSILKHFGNSDKKIGNAYLRSLVERIIDGAAADFDKRQKEIEEIIRERQEYAALPDATIETVQAEPSKTSTNNRRADVSKLSREEFDLILRDFVHARDLHWDEWHNVATIMREYGYTVEDFKAWSNDGDRRYDEKACESTWKPTRADVDKPVTIGTLIHYAQENGYQPNHARAKNFDGLKARLAELQKQPRSESRDKKIIANIRELCTWNHDKNNNRTTIKATVSNIELIFDNDPYLHGLFGFDKFQEENIFLKKAPWSEEDKAGEKWRDSDDANLRTYLRKNYAELKERQLIEDYVIVHSGQHSFHPVKKFIETLPQWDKTPRAETLFVKFLGAEDSEYTREVTLKWLLGFVARVYHPGCDFQWCPVLQGAQRIGKSKLVKMLGGKEGVNPSYQWHVALKDSVDDAHSVDALQKGGIIEIEEFSAARKAEINALKSFISAEEDTRRFAYDRRATTRKRHCVFVVTCNDQQFLRDTTGNARFWIVECSKKKFNRVDGMTPEYIRQVWAEVYHKYNELFKDGFDEAKLKPSEALEIRAEEIADAYVQDDGMTTEIKAFLDKKLPPAVVWKLATKEERRKFFTDGQITFDKDTLTNRRKARGGRDVDRDIEEIYALCNPELNPDGIQKILTSGEPLYRFFGSELREHICAAEIFNEAFGTGDKRKAMYRINEILSTLDGWHLGDRLQKADPEYSNQKKPYYRDENNCPAADDTTTEHPDDLWQGDPVDPDDTPF